VWSFLLEKNIPKVKHKLHLMDYKIVDFQDCHQKDFARLNYEWIEKYFKIEEEDRKALDQPREKIYSNGGHILLMQHKTEIVGTVAIIKLKEHYYELAKMSVDPKHQGKGLGYQLGLAAIEKAKELGAKTFYLETNGILKPAVKLYEKLGFKYVDNKPTPYDRCEIQMELNL